MPYFRRFATRLFANAINAEIFEDLLKFKMDLSAESLSKGVSTKLFVHSEILFFTKRRCDLQVALKRQLMQHILSYVKSIYHALFH
jgi:hypothetical protein